MAAKIPIRAVYNESDVATGLAEYQSGEFIGVAYGGTGAATFTAGILTADGTNAFTTVTAPSGTIVGTTDTQTLTNKTIDASSNTISNIGVSSLTSSGITIVDDSSTSATITLGETLKIAGTSSEIETAISGDTITIGLPSDVTVGNDLTVTNDLTVSNDLTVTGNLTVNGTTTTVNSTTIEVTNSFTFEGSTADDYETTLGVVDPTADRTINLPNVSGTLPVLAVASTTQITATPEELNYSDGVTSNIQTQLDAKASSAFAIAQAVALG